MSSVYNLGCQQISAYRLRLQAIYFFQSGEKRMKTDRLNPPALLALLILASLVLGACSPAMTPAPSGTSTEPVTLKIAVLPILDALPMYVAQQKGYFETEGVKVEFIPVGSAAERDQVMAAGQADGMINDLVSTLFYNKDLTQIQIVRFARTATPDYPQYRILVAGNSGITSLEELKGVEIGISEGSVIAYTTDRLLQAEGISPADIKTVAVPSIGDRMALLASGELKAANLPDPLALLAIQSGATVILDDTKHPEYGNSVYSFRKSIIDQHPEAVRGFLTALNQAIADINAAPKEWDSLLTEESLVPAPLIGSYQLPVFPGNSLPSEAQWADVLSWAIEKGLINADVSYKDSVNASFIN
jgi:NitT/TauT family transport system substrate-binding protein